MEFLFDLALEQAKPADLDALLPDGVINPYKLRVLPNAAAFAKSFFVEQAGRAICHCRCTVIETGAAHGRRMTCLSEMTRHSSACQSDLETDPAFSGYPAATLPLPAAWLPCGRSRSDPSSA
ncbi:DJ-1/PfpI family protein [Bradyrhizobium sp. 187]|uniref:DJ-1/PfpI family protein n=1 Tax=Bradyrhizobium sp. 187 TaxID=2782655 RepID=UPI001FFF6A68|nr:DJ-1/PfpI family protein [Bradyrhizobium sp. 187]